jgi:hypothetical protein
MENVYSHNKHDWVEDLEDAVEDAKEECLYDHDRLTVYIGDKVSVTNKSLSEDLGSVVVENMRDWAFEEVGDHSSSYLEDMDKDKLKQLSAHIVEWLDAHAEEPAFYGVTNIREYTE